MQAYQARRLGFALDLKGDTFKKFLKFVTALARVMDRLGITFGVLRKEKCTGDPARRLGNDLVFGQLAEQNLAKAAYAAETFKKAGAKVLFEGAQGTLLDIDHGTYPFVTSSTTVSGNAASGSGAAPVRLDQIATVSDAVQDQSHAGRVHRVFHFRHEPGMKASRDADLDRHAEDLLRECGGLAVEKER